MGKYIRREFSKCVEIIVELFGKSERTLEIPLSCTQASVFSSRVLGTFPHPISLKFIPSFNSLFSDFQFYHTANTKITKNRQD